MNKIFNLPVHAFVKAQISLGRPPCKLYNTKYKNKFFIRRDGNGLKK